MAKSKSSATPSPDPELSESVAEPTTDPGAPSPDPVAVPDTVPPHVAAVPVASCTLWSVSTKRQPTLVVEAADVTAARQRYADLLGVTWFGNAVDIEPAGAGAVASVWPPKE